MAQAKRLSEYNLFYEEIPFSDIGELEDAKITDLPSSEESGKGGLSEAQCAQLALDSLDSAKDTVGIPKTLIDGTLPTQLFDN